MKDGDGMRRKASRGTFLAARDAEWASLGWGDLSWRCGPRSTGARSLVMAEVKLAPGGCHDFHRHPRQEEVILVLEGKVEQWLGRRKRILGPGDGVFIPRGAVHATFNATRRPSRLLAFLGPAVGKEGYELVDVSGRAPWSSLRRPT